MFHDIIHIKNGTEKKSHHANMPESTVNTRARPLPKFV